MSSVCIDPHQGASTNLMGLFGGTETPLPDHRRFKFSNFNLGPHRHFSKSPTPTRSSSSHRDPPTTTSNEQTDETQRLDWSWSRSLQTRGNSCTSHFRVDLGAFTDREPYRTLRNLNVTSLPDAVASALASDVECRMHQVAEVRETNAPNYHHAHEHKEAARFMRHARRTTMTTDDIDQAFRVLNIEPLYGHSPHNPPHSGVRYHTLPTRRQGHCASWRTRKSILTAFYGKRR